MAYSDLCSGIVILIQWIFCSYAIVEHYSPRACVLSKSFQILSYYISTYSMMFIAIDRYMLIRYPHSQGLKMNKYFCCAITWLVGGLFSLTTLFNMRINEYFGPKHLISCRIAFPADGHLAFILRKHRVALLIVSQFFVPLLVIVCLYSIIWRTIQQREIVGNQADASRRKQFSKNKKKLIKMLIMVVVAFIVAWAPVHAIHFANFYIVQLLPRSCNSGWSLKLDCLLNSIGFLKTFLSIGVLYNLFYWLSISSCCFNPPIYYYGNPDFKREVVILYCKITGKRLLWLENSTRCLEMIWLIRIPRQTDDKGH